MRWLIVMSVLAMAAPAVAGVPTDNPKASTLDKAVQVAADTFFADSCHVELSMAVYDQGATGFYNYGTTSKSRPRLPGKDSLYEIGSVTKTFTGALAAKAVLDGRMTLDGDFRAYLKAAYPNLALNGKPVTLRTLATHTAGMPRDLPASDDLFAAPYFEKLPYQLLEREKPYDRARYLKELHDVRLASPPGETMAYSNIGLKLVGFGLEDVYGAAYFELLQRQILRPLGMTRTRLTLSWLDRPRRVEGYGPSGKPAPYILSNSGAAGGLLSTSRDMIKYAAWHLDESDPAIATAHTVLYGDAATYGEAFMLQVANDNGRRKLWQSGGVYGMSSQMVLFPDSRRAYVLLANDACFDTQSQLHAFALSVDAALSGTD